VKREEEAINKLKERADIIDYKKERKSFGVIGENIRE